MSQENIAGEGGGGAIRLDPLWEIHKTLERIADRLDVRVIKNQELTLLAVRAKPSLDGVTYTKPMGADEESGRFTGSCEVEREPEDVVELYPANRVEGPQGGE